MADMVLVPGNWLGAWAWDAVAPRLRAAGHHVTAVTLAGLAERAAEAGPGVDLDTHTDDVVRAIGERQGVVLVGHSYGGFPVTAAAERVPEQVARVVYVDSGPPPDGTSLLDFSPPEEQQRQREQAVDGLLPPPPWDPAQNPILGEVREPELALLRERSTPHPFGAVTQPVSRTGRLPVPAALVTCIFTGDQVREMIAAGNPYFTELAGAEIVELPTGHWPMFSEPERLAEILDRLAR
jgi:pimeloyl-ACP methyl ester carboxylesterase